MNPECRDGKHQNCDGVGYEESSDSLVDDACPCKCHRKEFTRP